MILPWHTDLFQPGRTVCVVFRASPLIWPTPYLARTTRPGPSALGQQGAPPVVLRAGLWVLACLTVLPPLNLQHRKAFSNLPIQGVADIAIGIHAAIAAAFHGRGVHGRPIFDFDR